MFRKRSVIAVCVILCSVGRIQAQVVDSLLDLYDAKVPQEKLHVHFDNSVYTPGQTIWYKAYLLKGTELSDISKNFYLDWFDEKGKLIERNIEPVIGSTASGNFTVPATYTGNRLQLLAYTKWMLNFDSAFLFHKIIPVAQLTKMKEDPAAKVPITTVRFFPEGGDLVEKVQSVIAFKALNSAGLPVRVNGIISNKNKKTVAAFSSRHDGMGIFNLTPEPEEVYTAEWKDPLDIIHYTVLPSAKKSGIVLSVKRESALPSFSIERPEVFEDRFKKITIVGTMNQQALFRAVAHLTDKQKITASLPTANFVSGVLQLTVFDANMQPLAERVVFVNNEEYRLETQFGFDTLNLGKRGKNVYSIEVPDSLMASLSLAITDGEGVYDSSRNIISQLLLSSEIRGDIYNPAYYFSSEDDSVLFQLDLVMLTNGWRRFAWNDVLQSKAPALSYQRDTGYLSIAGKINKLSDTKIKKAELVNLILMAKDSSKQWIFSPLRSDGSFSEENIIVFDTTKVFYQLNKTSLPGRSHVSIHNTFLPVDTTKRLGSLLTFLPDTTGLARMMAIDVEQRRLEFLMKQATLKEVVVHAKIKPRMEELNERYASGLFQGGDPYQFNIVDDKVAFSYPSVFAYLQSKVAGLQINGAFSPNPSAIWRGSRVSLFLDEFPTSSDMLAFVSMSDVAYIKVFRPPFFGASGGGSGGAISVYTKKGDDAKAMIPGLDFTLMPGYTPVKEFYSPNYADKNKSFAQTDLRRTVFWKPNIPTDGVNKKISISFYNNDISHTLQLVLEGVTQDGKLIHESRQLK